MKEADIQSIIEKEIPITRNMGVKFKEFTPNSSLVTVPLAPNHNHKGTVFGGSLYSVCAAACYGLIYSLQIKENLHEFDLVIGEGTIRYIKPVKEDFQVRAKVQLEDWEILKAKLEKNGFGKIPMTAKIFIVDEKASLCEFSATFVLMEIKK